MKSEEFWLGVCIYCVIALMGHFAPGFSKDGFFNKKITDIFQLPVSVNEMKVGAVQLPVHTVKADIRKGSKGSLIYIHVRSNESRVKFLPPGQLGSNLLPRRFRKPIEPIAFSL
jgi:hypothetical protein